MTGGHALLDNGYDKMHTHVEEEKLNRQHYSENLGL
jgi:hypothetical protein